MSLALLTLFFGVGALGVALVLVAVELAFSFDNAVINAKILSRLPPLWQRLFLTVGVVIAIFGMRVLFPMLIVMATSGLPLGQVADLALNHPAQYADKLVLAHPSISAFGGSFLLMWSLHFFMEEREVLWIRRIEQPLAGLARWWLPAVVTLGMVALFAYLPANHHGSQSLRAGLAGVLLYLAINLFTELLGRLASGSGAADGRQVGLVALLTFIYLQILDASFSLDGVIGAFAITNQIVLIAVGLGVGAIWVRSLTVYMVQRGTLAAYKYLEHGAHYAVLVLALAMFISLLVDVPQLITGLVGLGLICASAAASVQARHSD